MFNIANVGCAQRAFGDWFKKKSLKFMTVPITGKIYSFYSLLASKL